jgi:hypothetical protein
VARKYGEWQPGSPQQRVQEAVLDRYGVMERFFEAVATRARVQRDSASKTFYAVMRRERSLPAAQRDAWLELTPIDPETLDAIEAGRGSRRPPKKDPLTDLQEELEEARAYLDSAISKQALVTEQLGESIAGLEERLSLLETARGRDGGSRQSQGQGQA